jgi:hypothetical protein
MWATVVLKFDAGYFDSFLLIALHPIALLIAITLDILELRTA